MLQLVPIELVRAYHRAMLNIHPALLPAFGGQGFYGERVHKVCSGARSLTFRMARCHELAHTCRVQAACCAVMLVSSHGFKASHQRSSVGCKQKRLQSLRAGLARHVHRARAAT